MENNTQLKNFYSLDELNEFLSEEKMMQGFNIARKYIDIKIIPSQPGQGQYTDEYLLIFETNENFLKNYINNNYKQEQENQEQRDQAEYEMNLNECPF